MTTKVDHSNGSFRALEKVVESRQGLAAGCFIHVGLDLLSGRDMRVPEDDLCVPGRDVKVFQQGRSGVLQMV